MPGRSVMSAKRLVKRIARNFGVQIVRHQDGLSDLSETDRQLIDFVRPYTMTSPERVFGLANATRWLVESGVSGDIVECGVWRGGSMMAVAKTLLEANPADADLYLFETFV